MMLHSPLAPASVDQSVIRLEDLHVAYQIHRRWVNVVRGISFNIGRGETFGLVGESGCGKSTVALAIMGYLGRNGRVTEGKIDFLGEDLKTKTPHQMQALRGSRISMVYQDPQSALNPSLRVGRQIGEVLRVHEGLGPAEIHERVLTMLERVHMPDPEAVMHRYPHQLSGGMQQRVLIATALITNPDLLIMDEPTTGLDVTTEAAVLDLVNELKQSYDTAILYISHNLGVIANVCDRVGVMYAGQLVEVGDVATLFYQPHHPYTADLLECIPRLEGHGKANGRLQSIEGQVPLPTQLPAGCVFRPRCRFARERCRGEVPALMQDSHGHWTRCLFADEVAQESAARNALSSPVAQGYASGDEADPKEAVAPGTANSVEVTESGASKNGDGQPMLKVKDLRKYFGHQRKQYVLFGPRQPQVKAVDGVSFEINEGETLALVGESGCGKTTLGRAVVGLLAPTEGEIDFRGEDISMPVAQRPAGLRKAMQIVFQNPYASLNPRRTVGRMIDRVLYLFGVHDARHRKQRAVELLEAVRLDASYLRRYPAQLSGGEKQRVAIARAFAGTPSLVVCDEAVSALDVSVQASILNLLGDLKQEQGCGYLFISHDLSVVRYLADRVGVMYLGHLMEFGPAERIFAPPSHPYTAALLSAIQVPDPNTAAARAPIRLEGPVPSPMNPPRGCPFHTRCPQRIGPICDEERPPWQAAGDGHRIRCHIPLAKL